MAKFDKQPKIVMTAFICKHNSQGSLEFMRTKCNLKIVLEFLIIKGFVYFLTNFVNVFNLEFLPTGRNWRNVEIRNMFEFQAFAVKQKTCKNHCCEIHQSFSAINQLKGKAVYSSVCSTFYRMYRSFQLSVPPPPLYDLSLKS